MNNKPMALTAEEMKEIAAIEVIRQIWGADNAAQMEQMLDEEVYAVKLNFQSGGAGYIGDLFILQRNAIGVPLQLIRNRDRNLVYCW